ncbi:MAG: APC family permease [Acidobacteria bacterium]|nr:APC family permease [Acidobacteriota bacterium]
MTHLARKLRTIDYFTIGFGTMVGVGWLVVMDDWLQRGGPIGAILGFSIGGLLLLPIGYVYARLVIAMPDSASEIAYTSRVFPESISFATGWLMMLAYVIVCPWEAVAVGRIAAYLFPQLNRIELYRILGQPVFLPHLLIGLALTAVITYLNYRGIQFSAAFQNWTTFGLLILFVLFASCGVLRGSAANFRPGFSHSRIVSILLVVQIVPYFMTGFESVAKCSEEARPGFQSSGFFKSILIAILVGTAFYTAVTAIVSYVYPWRGLTAQSFATAYAFRRTFGSEWIVNVILATALLSLLKVYNGNFLASSRLLFALGRRRMIDSRAGYIHPGFQTPAVAVLAIGVLTAVLVFLGTAILIPITEVGSMASACGWLAACASYLLLERNSLQRLVALAGATVAVGLIAMKVLPFVPGHFTGYEWVTLAAWGVLGVVLHRRTTSTEKAVTTGS